MRRRLEIQKAVRATDGLVSSCPPCVRCGGEMRCDSPGDYDPLKPKYVEWHEGWDCYEFDHGAETWSVYLMRCTVCSTLRTHVEKRTIDQCTARDDNQGVPLETISDAEGN
jgi:hypothetical protein